MTRYTVCYQGYLFHGDEDGWNFHDTDSWEDAISLVHWYGDMIYVEDNEYGVTFHNGEWY